MPSSTTSRKRPGSKNMSYFSHEFIITNHGDIATCTCMLFIVGLLFQKTAPLSTPFVALRHNITEYDPTLKEPVQYSYGPLDLCLVFFYTIAVIIFHAVIQEYVLDKVNRKIKLSKARVSKLNDSGHMVSFYLVSLFMAFMVFKDEGYFQSLNFFWTGYPHLGLTFMTKFFFIIQMSYWIHTLPELYLQKIKREEYPSRITYSLINLAVCFAVYILNFSRIGITLLAIEQIINLLFHVSRILHFVGKNKAAKIGFNVYNFLFVIGRLSVIILSIFVFWFGLKTTSVDAIDFEKGNFNTFPVRLVCLITVLALQALLMWNFMLFQCKKLRETTKSIKYKTTNIGNHSKKSPTKLREDAGTSGSELETDNEKIKSN